MQNAIEIILYTNIFAERRDDSVSRSWRNINQNPFLRPWKNADRLTKTGKHYVSENIQQKIVK